MSSRNDFWGSAVGRPAVSETRKRRFRGTLKQGPNYRVLTFKKTSAKNSVSVPDCVPMIAFVDLNFPGGIDFRTPIFQLPELATFIGAEVFNSDFRYWRVKNIAVDYCPEYVEGAESGYVRTNFAGTTWEKPPFPFKWPSEYHFFVGMNWEGLSSFMSINAMTDDAIMQLGGVRSMPVNKPWRLNFRVPKRDWLGILKDQRLTTATSIAGSAYLNVEIPNYDHQIYEPRYIAKGWFPAESTSQMLGQYSKIPLLPELVIGGNFCTAQSVGGLPLTYPGAPVQNEWLNRSHWFKGAFLGGVNNTQSNVAHRLGSITLTYTIEVMGPKKLEIFQSN